MEVANKGIKIETTQLLNDFKQHLDFEKNKRMLFSGPFGTGKSTFLKEFSEKECDDYFYLKIFPVNYSVSNNEDVFELIKFDLLMQLMGNYYEEINLKKEDFTLLLKSQMFIMERMKFMPLLYAILGLSEKIGTPIVDFIKALEKTVGDFKEFSNEIKIDEADDITSFLASIEQKKGSHHEMDVVSDLILDLVGRIKEAKGNAQSVLIIDDLDRLDPEHIFRLFNIFSAHYDEINGENKFGFDKVIFVCDIENIRKIFHHKYGKGVDFSGYIDKFYSLAPFDFDNRKYIQEKVSDFIDSLQFASQLEMFSTENDKNTYIVTRDIITALIETKQLNIRMLLNIPKIKIDILYFRNNNGDEPYTTHNTPLIIIFHILKQFYGSFGILEEKLIYMYEILDKNKYNYNSSTMLISFCLPFIFDIPKKAFPNMPFHKTEKYSCFVHYDVPFGGDYNIIGFKGATKEVESNSENVLLNSFEVLIDAFRVCKKRGLLR